MAILIREPKLRPMKQHLAVWLFVLAGVTGCSSQLPFAGTWDLMEYVTIMEGDTVVTDRTQMEQKGMFWQMTLHEDGTYEQVARGDRSRETEENRGTWHLEEDILVVQIPSERGRAHPIRYRYERKGNKLYLERDIMFPEQKLLITFRK